MATQNSSNQKFSNDSDGFTLGGGSTQRNLSVTGANITLTGSGSNTHTFPSSSDTLVGRNSTDTLTNKTLTTPKIDSVLDTSGNTIIGLSAVASAVNYINFNNQATGATPVLNVAGSDTNISFNIRGKGTGRVRIQDGANISKIAALDVSSTLTTVRTFTFPDTDMTFAGVDAAQTLTNKTLTAPKIANGGFIADANGNEQIIFNTTASAVNELTVANAATGGAPSLKATGGDTDIALNLQSKGSAAVQLLDTNGNVKFATSAGLVANAVNYPYAQNAVSGSAAVLASWGADTNVDLNFITKGSGIVKANGNPIISTVTAIPAVTGTPSSSTYLRGDGTWATPSGGSGTFADNVFTLQDDGDATKQLKFQLSGITTGTTRTLTVPNANTTLVGTDTTDILYNKTLDSPKVNQVLDTNGNLSFSVGTPATPVNYMYIVAAPTGGYPSFTAAGTDTDVGLAFSPQGAGMVEIYLGSGQTSAPFGVAGSASNIDLSLTAKGTGVVKANGVEVATISGTQTLTNKTLGNTNVIILKDTNFTLQDDGDTTKQLKFQLSGIATGTTRTLTVPNASTTLVGADTTDTLSNKTLTAPKFADLGYIADPNGNEMLRFDQGGSSAVNEITIGNGATGIGPYIQSTGDDATIHLNLYSKGTGSIYLKNDNDTVIFRADGSFTTSAVNYVYVGNAATGNAVTVGSYGTDTNVDLDLVTKGSGKVKANGNSVISSVTSIPAVTGTPSSSTYLRGDGTWATPAGGGATGTLQPVRVAAETGLTYTISAGTVTQIAGTTIAGVSVAIGDRILVVGAPASTGAGVANSNQPGNGVYVVTGNTTNITLSRSSDMSGSNSPIGQSVFVSEGTGWGGWIAFFNSPSSGTFTWGTTALKFTGYFKASTDAVYTGDTQTLTNKQIQGRVGTITNSATPSINIDNYDVVKFTSLNTNITSMTTNLTGTPYAGQKILWKIKDDGTARTITWGASFQSSGIATLLSTTVAGKTHYMLTVYDADASKHTCIAVDPIGY